MNVHHVYAGDSANCASVKPSTVSETTAASAWTALLLEHHHMAGEGAPFETLPTDDLTLVVASTATHELAALAGGRWRTAIQQPGNACLTPPGQTSRLRWRTPSAKHAAYTIQLYLPGSLLAETIDEYRRLGQRTAISELSVLSFRDPVVANQAQLLLSAYRDGAPDLYAANAARWLVTHLLSQQAGWRHITDDQRHASPLSDHRLLRTIEFMSANLHRPLTVEALAGEAHISPHHFARRFREGTGMGPASYLTSLRMEKARRLLRTTDLTIAEIAYQCGYARPDTFATAFRRNVGDQPSSYRAAR